jgi:hypothetical protein
MRSSYRMSSWPSCGEAIGGCIPTIRTNLMSESPLDLYLALFFFLIAIE